LISDTLYYAFMSVSEEAVGVDVDGLVFPAIGVYLSIGENFYISSLTIPGYTGFTKEVLKKEVLPKATAVANAAGSTPTAAEYNALLTALRDAGYLAT
jgi:hypothetical protein